MNKGEKIVQLKLDIIFKRVFGNDKNESIIAAFVSDMLDIPRNRITRVEIKNVELAPEEIEQKFSRLDLNLFVDGKKINIARTVVGNYMTSLDMEGFSITLLKLDPELEELLNAPADTPAFVQA